MFLRTTLAALAISAPMFAQADQDASALFYKAYFLDNEKASDKAASAKALELYTKFLAANPTHKLAAKAAARATIILYSTGDLAKARAFAKKHSALVTKAEEAQRAARENRSEGNQEVSEKLMEAMRTAREDGNDAESSRIMAALRRAGGRTRGRGGFGRGGRGGFGGGRGGQGGGRGGFGGGRGGFGGGRGGRGGRGGNRGGGFTIPKIAGMKQEEAAKAVEALVTSAERMIDLLAQRGNADQADKLEAKLDKIQDLVDDNKLADAQKLLDTLQADMGAMGGSGRGGRGGDQGGRRRRGGDAGGAGGAGGERRRRGGDAGGAGGERRRRGGDAGGAGGDAGAGGERRRRRG